MSRVQHVEGKQCRGTRHVQHMTLSALIFWHGELKAPVVQWTMVTARVLVPVWRAFIEIRNGSEYILLNLFNYGEQFELELFKQFRLFKQFELFRPLLLNLFNYCVQFELLKQIRLLNLFNYCEQFKLELFKQLRLLLNLFNYGEQFELELFKQFRLFKQFELFRPLLLNLFNYCVQFELLKQIRLLNLFNYCEQFKLELFKQLRLFNSLNCSDLCI
ncbi:hypothetical protein GPALN_015048 [Globodera pallida]|nr:hypothetical protein GPALN_015048 [Globodera pallida]